MCRQVAFRQPSNWFCASKIGETEQLSRALAARKCSWRWMVSACSEANAVPMPLVPAIDSSQRAPTINPARV
ncbi:hypothetical protein D3C80_1755000 [compost metagenome]